MRNTNKKGFTIVELVVVVAVIAILAAVLIPTFSGIIRRANESKDTQLVKHLNTAIAADVNGDKTMAGAIAAAAEFGFDVEKINAKVEGNEILWDSVNNVFCYLNNGEIEYIDGSEYDVDDAAYWVIDDSVNPTYSTYLVNYEGTEVEAKHSLDVSACGAVDVTYKSNGTVSIFTNGGSLTVENGAVTHYGTGYILTVADGAKSAYVEKGSFAANADEIVNAGDKATAEGAGYVYVTSAEELATALADKAAKIALGANIAIEADPSVGYDFTVLADVELNLNGYDIVSVHNNATGSATKNNGVFSVDKAASFTLTGAGNITFETNSNMGWNNCTAVIASRGDIIIDGAVRIANLGGADMSYAIDVYSWGDAESVNVTIKSGMVYSADYNAIRLNKQSPGDADMTKTFNLVVDGGVIEGAHALMVHDGSAAANGVYNITLNSGVLVSTASSNLVKNMQNLAEYTITNNGATIVTK